MKKLLLSSTIAVCTLVLFGCPADPAECGTPEAFDVSNCSAAELAGLDRTGVWHGIAAGADGGTFVSVVSYEDPADPMVHGHSSTVADFDGGYFLSTNYVDSNTGNLVGVSYAGCHSSGSGNLTGAFQLCLNRVSKLRGDFEMNRLERPTGEVESSHLTLRGTAAVTQGTPLGLWVANNIAYVAAGSGGIATYDVSNPDAPVLLQQKSFPDDYVSDVLVKDDVLYVASLNRGITLFNVSSLLNPIGSQPSQPTSMVSLALSESGTRLLANSSETGAVMIFDVTNATSPLLLGSFFPGNPGGLSNLYPHASASVGNSLFASYGPLGFVAADVTQPSSPVQLGTALAPDGATPDNLVAATFGSNVYGFESSSGWNGHVRILDLTTPSAAAQVGTYVLRPEVSAGRVDLVGTKLYIAHHQYGVRILDVTNPLAPVLFGYFHTWADTQPGRGVAFYEGANAVRGARDGSGLVYALDDKRGLLVFQEVP